jgi:low temperature requirement protein LtrA
LSAGGEAEAESGIERVSTLELFFDLVFVFTITQLTSVLASRPTGEGVLRVVLMLGVIWWMYGGYAWLTNTVAPDSGTRQLLLLGGMVGFLVCSLAIPTAFDGGGEAFVIGYAGAVLIHGAMFMRANATSFAQTFKVNGAMVLALGAGVLAGGAAQHAIWGAVVVAVWGYSLLMDSGGFVIGPSHLVERHGLVVIVAIGESVVAVGIGASGLDLTFQLVGVAVLGLALSACLWWAYFGGDDERAERALQATPAAERPNLVLRAFGVWHIALLAGIIAIASVLERAIAHAPDGLSFARALILAAGVSVYLAADVLFRRSLRIHAGSSRTAVAVLALATIPLGTEVDAAAQLAALVALFAGALALEPRALPSLATPS